MNQDLLTLENSQIIKGFYKFLLVFQFGVQKHQFFGFPFAQLILQVNF